MDPVGTTSAFTTPEPLDDEGGVPFALHVADPLTLDAAIDEALADARARGKIGAATSRVYQKAMHFVFPPDVRNLSVQSMREADLDVVWARAVMRAAPTRYPVMKTSWRLVYDYLTGRDIPVPMGAQLRTARARGATVGRVAATVSPDLIAQGVRIARAAGITVRAAANLDWNKIRALPGDVIVFMGEQGGRCWYIEMGTPAAVEFVDYWQALGEPKEGAFFPAQIGSTAPLPLSLLQVAYHKATEPKAQEAQEAQD